MNKLIWPLLLLPTLFFVACRKNPPVAPDAAQLKIQLDGIFMKSQEIDSALIVWKIGDKQVQKKLTKEADVLSISIDSLKLATDQIEVRIFNNRLIKFHRFAYAKIINKPASRTTPVTIAGPLNLTDASWMPRVLLRDAGNGIIAVAGITPGDPFFGLYNVADKWRDIEVFKGYYQGINGVAGNTWFCLGNDCTRHEGTIENVQTFSSLPAQIGSRPYNHVEIVAMFGTGNYRDGWSVLDFTFDF